MAVKPWLTLILLAFSFCASLVAAQVPTPAERLVRPLSETSLNPRARGLLEEAMAGAEIKGNLLEHAVQLTLVSHQWVVYRGLWMDVHNYLNKHGLRLGLTSPEVEHYREHGHLPPPTLDSTIEALALQPAYTFALHNNGAHTLGDVLKIRRRRNGELMVNGLGKQGVKEIAEAMGKLGFPLNPKEDPLPDEESASWSALKELSLKTLMALSKAKINEPEQLLAMAEFEIEQISGIGPQEIVEIGVFFKNHNAPLYDTLLDRSIEEWRALDLALPIHPAARLSPDLRHHLDFLGVETFADFLNPHKIQKIYSKPLPTRFGRELKSFVHKFHQALLPTMEAHAQICGMALM